MIPKFRAWWIQDEVMTHIDTLEFLQGGIRVSDGCWHEKFLGDEVILMQSTGLKDKNGVEIFEGDIVKCTRGCPHEIIRIEEYGGTFFGGMPAWYLSGLKEGYAWTGEEEIIGNIYENPELLEVEG